MSAENGRDFRRAASFVRLCRRHEGLLDGWDGVRRKLSLFWSMVGTFDNLLYVGYLLLLVVLGAVFAGWGMMRIRDLFVFLSMAGTFMNFVWDFQAEAYRALKCPYRLCRTGKK